MNEHTNYELERITSALGKAYRSHKESEKEKNRLRTEFFNMADISSKDESFKYVNKEDGYVYGRSYSSSVSVDDAKLKEEDPGLWEEISTTKTEVVLRPLEDLSHEQLLRLQQYIINNSPVAKLLAPRKASESELSE